MNVAIKKLTWDDIKEWPECQGRTEIVDGELIMSPVPSDRHQEISTLLGIQIGLFVFPRRLGKFYSSPVHVVLAEGVDYEPDLCFISADRLHILQPPVIKGPPDLIIEIISESNRTHDTVVKFRDYERFGVREYWIVDPRDEHIRIYGLDADKYALLGVFARGEKIVSRVLAGIELDPAQVF